MRKYYLILIYIQRRSTSNPLLNGQGQGAFVAIRVRYLINKLQLVSHFECRLYNFQ